MVISHPIHSIIILNLVIKFIIKKTIINFQWIFSKLNTIDFDRNLHNLEFEHKFNSKTTISNTVNIISITKGFNLSVHY